MNSEAQRPSRPSREEGQISVLLVGMIAITLLLITGGVGVTAVHVGRIQLLDAADAAALDAADAVDAQALYDQGFSSGPPLSAQTVQQAASQHLSSRTRPSRIQAWQVRPGSGTPDGRTAVVVLSGDVSIPGISTVLSAFGGSISVTVESRARSQLPVG